MFKLVTIYGGSGFVGRYVARRMAKAGWRVRVAVRRPNEALFVRPFGAVGQVEPVFCNIRDDESVRAAMIGADAVVNCVGVLVGRGKNSFDAVHVDGAERIARLATEQGVAQLVQMSAIGADSASESTYASTKGKGEAATLAVYPDVVILRPSIIFGAEDEFFNRFAKMTRFGPVLPIVGADTRFQPVYVDDVAKAVQQAVEGGVAPGVYELGGPDVSTFRELMDQMLRVIQRRRLVINVPFPVARMKAYGLDMIEKISLGLVRNGLITRDQVRTLRYDNVVADGAKGFADLEIAPVPSEAVLPDYLWPYRPSGQYAAIKDSAKNLRAR
ncbi:complex I NDUFA9 subunit family protein [Puniceibacterium sp. IMCC21224]|uniref:complex I NDUFA9 subunit family protein n=1 Tax=Puniceibacterium sp. IMCC21224 TaxID=1618204 RepID=UPI00064DCD55|nr:complex I NDUFA9 subunit family protein [Puniceibacterium sp. IMCC21224]KMK65787.1 NADH dehydrogenase [Puniceibacterium sp. IMCC21224]